MPTSKRRCGNGKIEDAKAALDAGADPNAFVADDSYPDRKMPMLYLAYDKGDLTYLKLLLDRGANVNVRDANGVPLVVDAIHGAKTSRRPATDLSKNPQLNYPYDPRQSVIVPDALAAAATRSDAALVNELIRRGALVNASDFKTGDTALHIAIRHKNVPAIRALMARGADTLTEEQTRRNASKSYARELHCNTSNAGSALTHCCQLI
jgi:ankyrin repeat protein